MYLCFTPFLFLLILYLLIRFLFAKRYETPIITLIFVVTTIVSGIIAGKYYGTKISDYNENILEYTNPATEWEKLDVLDSEALSIEYRSGAGLFALTKMGEQKITKPIPYCLVESQTAEIPPESVKISAESYQDFPSPPLPFKQQLGFEMHYAVEYDILGLSSFVVLENGEIWCSERVFRGPADFPNAVALGMSILFVAVAVFMGSFFVLLIISFTALEIYQRKAKTKVA